MKQLLMTKKDNESLINEFLEDCQLRGLSPSTIENYISMPRIFNEFLNGKTFYEIKKEDIQDFIRYLKEVRKVSQKRIANYLYAISSFYDYLLFENIIDNNPVDIIKKDILEAIKEETPHKQES